MDVDICGYRCREMSECKRCNNTGAIVDNRQDGFQLDSQFCDCEKGKEKEKQFSDWIDEDLKRQRENK